MVSSDIIAHVSCFQVSVVRRRVAVTVTVTSAITVRLFSALKVTLSPAKKERQTKRNETKQNQTKRNRRTKAYIVVLITPLLLASSSTTCTSFSEVGQDLKKENSEKSQNFVAAWSRSFSSGDCIHKRGYRVAARTVLVPHTDFMRWKECGRRVRCYVWKYKRTRTCRLARSERLTHIGWFFQFAFSFLQRQREWREWGENETKRCVWVSSATTSQFRQRRTNDVRTLRVASSSSFRSRCP